MNLTKQKLESIWGNKESIFAKQTDLNNRFKSISKLITEILLEDKRIEFDDLKIKIGGNERLMAKGAAEEVPPSIDYFGPAINGLPEGKRFCGITNQASAFYDKDKDEYELVVNLLSIMGGFDFKTHKMEDKYRIVSNTYTDANDYKGTLISQGQMSHPSSHFSDNTYFFQVMWFLQHANDSDVLQQHKIALRYPKKPKDKEEPNQGYTGWLSGCDITNDEFDHDNKEEEKQRELLNSRFPLKFLWMWANKSTVIHPMSLMAFRNFLNTEYMRSILKEINKEYTPEKVTNMEFEEFVREWEKISEKILNDLGNDVSDISKLISIITTEETDIKNISDLVKTGNRAVILWGPPGTGKTYESMEVIKELLVGDQAEDKDVGFKEKYLFSWQSSNYKNDQGYYEIIQFHPNYTYEDFIGGISPKIDGSNVSYELREGVFYKFCKEAEKNLGQKYIFIIDEINRAELSAVFGELLFALEYRGTPIKLPHFTDIFNIPKNVYIIGTMNNVDKSLVTFDLALRRRFGFFKLMPKLDVIANVLEEKIESASLEKYVVKCKQLNILISKLDNQELNASDEELIRAITDSKKHLLRLGEDYQIGQAYFLKIKDFLPEGEDIKITSFDLEKLWVYNIEPLLEEYLGMSMEDDSIKAQLVNLKDFFIEDK